MRVFVTLFALCLGLASAEYTTFQWQSCTTDKANQALKVLSAEVHPMPVLTPGPLIISFSAKILKEIHEAVLDFEFIRHTTLTDVRMPCLDGIGSCVLDGCSIVSNLINGSRDTQRDLGHQLKAMFDSVGVFSSCPIAVQDITITNYTINIQSLSSALDFLTDGDYTVTVIAKHPATTVQYGCFKFNVTFKRKHASGWLLGRRRRSTKKEHA